MPASAPPQAGRREWLELISGAIGIVLIMFAEALAAGRTFAAKNRYEINANKELLALGAANLASGMCGGIVASGGMSGAAANAAGGARTQMSTIVASLLSMLTLAFLLRLLHDLADRQHLDLAYRVVRCVGAGHSQRSFVGDLSHPDRRHEEDQHTAGLCAGPPWVHRQICRRQPAPQGADDSGAADL